MSISITVAGNDHTTDVIDFTYSVDHSSLDINASFLSQSAFTMDDEVVLYEDGIAVFSGKIRDVTSEILIGGKRLYTYHLSNPTEPLKTKRWSANGVNGQYDYDLLDGALTADNIPHSIIGTIQKTAVQNDGWQEIPYWQGALSMALFSGWAINWKNGTLYFQKSDYSDSSTQAISGSDTINLKSEYTKDVLNSVHLVSRQDNYSVTAENSSSISQHGKNEMNTQTMFGNAGNLDDAAVRIVDNNRDPSHTLEFDTNIRLDATKQVVASFSGDISDLSGRYTVEKEEHTYMSGAINHHYVLRELLQDSNGYGQYHNTQLIQKNDIINKAVGTNAFSNTPSDSALPDIGGIAGAEGGGTGQGFVEYSENGVKGRHKIIRHFDQSEFQASPDGESYSIVSALYPLETISPSLSTVSVSEVTSDDDGVSKVFSNAMGGIKASEKFDSDNYANAHRILKMDAVTNSDGKQESIDTLVEDYIHSKFVYTPQSHGISIIMVDSKEAGSEYAKMKRAIQVHPIGYIKENSEVSSYTTDYQLYSSSYDGTFSFILKNEYPGFGFSCQQLHSTETTILKKAEITAEHMKWEDNVGNMHEIITWPDRLLIYDKNHNNISNPLLEIKDGRITVASDVPLILEQLDSSITITGNLNVNQNTDITGNATFHGDTTVNGITCNGTDTEDLNVNNYAYIEDLHFNSSQGGYIVLNQLYLNTLLEIRNGASVTVYAENGDRQGYTGNVVVGDGSGGTKTLKFANGILWSVG